MAADRQFEVRGKVERRSPAQAEGIDLAKGVDPRLWIPAIAIVVRILPGDADTGSLPKRQVERAFAANLAILADRQRSEEHTSELQSLMRISYAVFCLKKNIHPLPSH